MRARTAVLVVVLGLLGAVAPGVARADPVAFTDAYPSYDSLTGCRSTQAIPGYEPADGGRHPVFIYVHGFTGDYANEWRIVVQEAARLGFVAAAPRYTSLLTVTKSGVQGHAGCIFGTGATTALSKLCARPDADCSKGVVVSGLSLGATIAARAANVSPYVRAAYLIGTFQSFETWMLAAPRGTRALPDDALRMTFGREDATNYDTVNALTGRSCTTPNCIGPDGSGWYAVQDAEVADHHADHCFHFYSGGCYGTQEPFDPGWRPPSRLVWGLDPALEWGLGRTSP